MGLRRRLDRIEGNLRGATDHSHRLMLKAEELIDEISDLICQLEENGIEAELEVAGRVVPVKLTIKPGS